MHVRSWLLASVSLIACMDRDGDELDSPRVAQLQARPASTKLVAIPDGIAGEWIVVMRDAPTARMLDPRSSAYSNPRA